MLAFPVTPASCKLTCSWKTSHGSFSTFSAFNHLLSFFVFRRIINKLVRARAHQQSSGLHSIENHEVAFFRLGGFKVAFGQSFPNSINRPAESGNWTISWNRYYKSSLKPMHVDETCRTAWAFAQLCSRSIPCNQPESLGRRRLCNTFSSFSSSIFGTLG